MKILFTSTGNTWDSIIDPRFGRAEYLVLYDEETDSLSATDNSAVKMKPMVQVQRLHKKCMN